MVVYKKYNKHYLKFILVLITLFSGYELISYAGDTANIEHYINYGLKHNLKLKQKQSNYEKYMVLLKQSKSLFYPELNMNARYTVADGGRVIEFPVGDLLNPVYQNLNKINAYLNPFVDEYPMVENREFSFYRPKEHETKLTMSLPLYVPELWNKKNIHQELLEMHHIGVDQYMNELIAEIKIAYYNYQKVLQLQDLLGYSRKLTAEHLRVAQSLYKHDKVTVDHVLRAERVQQELDVKAAEIRKNEVRARNYFNFLLNRNLDEDIDTSLLYNNISYSYKTDTSIKNQVDHLPAYQMMNQKVKIKDEMIALNETNYLPDILAHIDYGFQGEEYRFTKDDDFVLASLVLRWTLFKGFYHRRAVQKAQIEKEMAELQQKELAQSLVIQIKSAYESLKTAAEKIALLEKTVSSAEATYRIVQKKYEQAMVPHIEYLQARTELLEAREKLIVAMYEYQIEKANYDKVSGNIDLTKYKHQIE